MRTTLLGRTDRKDVIDKKVFRDWVYGMSTATGYVFPLVVCRAISLVTPPLKILPPNPVPHELKLVENVPPIEMGVLRDIHGAPLANIMSTTAMLDPVFFAIRTTSFPSQ
jgi:hypothetical protein